MCGHRCSRRLQVCRLTVLAYGPRLLSSASPPPRQTSADLSYPVLAVSIDRRLPDPAAAAGAALLGASPSKPAAAAAAAAAVLSAAAGNSPAGLSPTWGPGATGGLATAAGLEAAPAGGVAAAAGQQGQQAQQRWISMEATPGSRLGLLHWGQVRCAGGGGRRGAACMPGRLGRRQQALGASDGLSCCPMRVCPMQVFNIPTSLSEVDCQVGLGCAAQPLLLSSAVWCSAGRPNWQRMWRTHPRRRPRRHPPLCRGARCGPAGAGTRRAR